MSFNGNCYQGICFDLFGTLIFFDHGSLGSSFLEASPALRTAECLDALLKTEFPELSKEAFAAGLEAASVDLREESGEELYEYPSAERFRRAVLRAGVEPGRVREETIQRLVTEHMRILASAIFFPRHYGPVLRELSSRYRLALVSNFDHAPTVRYILRRSGISDLFATVVISVEVGRRKPHPLLFETALEGMGVEAAAAMHVGDSLRADVAGARQAGMTSVWVTAGEEKDLDGDADLVISEVPALADILG